MGTQRHMVHTQPILNYLSWVTSIIEFKETRQSLPHAAMQESIWLKPDTSEILMLQLVDYITREEILFKYEDIQGLKHL